MVNLCNLCKKLIEDGDKVLMTVTGTYSAIPSVNSFRMPKSGLMFVPGSMAHKECTDKKDED